MKGIRSGVWYSCLIHPFPLPPHNCVPPPYLPRNAHNPLTPFPPSSLQLLWQMMILPPTLVPSCHQLHALLCLPPGSASSINCVMLSRIQVFPYGFWCFCSQILFPARLNLKPDKRNLDSLFPLNSSGAEPSPAQLPWQETRNWSIVLQYGEVQGFLQERVNHCLL